MTPLFENTRSSAAKCCSPLDIQLRKPGSVFSCIPASQVQQPRNYGCWEPAAVLTGIGTQSAERVHSRQARTAHQSHYLFAAFALIEAVHRKGKAISNTSNLRELGQVQYLQSRAILKLCGLRPLLLSKPLEVKAGQVRKHAARSTARCALVGAHTLA